MYSILVFLSFLVPQKENMPKGKNDREWEDKVKDMYKNGSIQTQGNKWKTIEKHYPKYIQNIQASIKIHTNITKYPNEVTKYPKKSKGKQD